MRKLLLIAIATCCFFSVYHLYHFNPAKKVFAHKAIVDPVKIGEDENEANEDGIAQAQQMEFELTKDVSLGYIPKYRLVNAYQDLMAKRKLSPNTPNNVSALTWTE